MSYSCSLCMQLPLFIAHISFHIHCQQQTKYKSMSYNLSFFVNPGLFQLTNHIIWIMIKVVYTCKYTIACVAAIDLKCVQKLYAFASVNIFSYCELTTKHAAELHVRNFPLTLHISYCNLPIIYNLHVHWMIWKTLSYSELHFCLGLYLAS